MKTDQVDITLLLTQYGLPILQSVIAVIAAWLIYFLIDRAILRSSISGLIPHDMRRLLRRVVKWLILVVLLLVILGLFGISVTSFWAALSGVLALIAVAIVAVWSVLSNIFCSVLLAMFSPFRINDMIEVQDPGGTAAVGGRVITIDLMYTTLKVADENDDGREEHYLRIPNNIFFQKYIRTWESNQSETVKQYLAREHEGKQSG